LKDWMLWILVGVIIFLMVFVVMTNRVMGSDVLLEACYEQLDESNALIEDLFVENQRLKNKVKELEEEIKSLKESNAASLLTECYDQLNASNEIITDLQEQNTALRVVKDEYKNQLNDWKKRWLTGLSLSYPFGLEINQEYLFSKFGLIMAVGYSEDPFVKFGFMWRY